MWLIYPLSLPTLAVPVLLLCMLGVRSSCMGTNAANLFLHMDVAGWAGFWINHYLFCTLCAFELVGTGMVGGGFMWFLFDCVCCCLLFFYFFIFFIWIKEAETCLKVFQLPVFLFDITCPSILCQSPKGNRKLSLSVSEATSCLNQKIMENTQFLLSRQGGTPHI